LGWRRIVSRASTLSRYCCVFVPEIALLFCLSLRMDPMVQFNLGDSRFSCLRMETGCLCLIGKIAMFVGTPEAPHTQLVLANGYGEAMGWGFPGGAREREAIIDKALKDAGYDGQLSRAEFLAILIIVGFGTDRPAAEFADGGNGDVESPETPIFNQACKLVAPDGYRTRYERSLRERERARGRGRQKERRACM
jgi:hypothetical protein